nr:hypothetical protein [Tanacetum cinerariifolium]
MEPINHFGFSYNNINQHLPIRKFSQAARAEEQHQYLSDDHTSWELVQQFDDQVYPPDMEEYQFVDNFFNIDQYNGNTSGDSLSSPEANQMQPFDPFVDIDFDLDLDTFLMPDENTDVPMTIQTENQDQTMENGVDDGLQLVHLLLACAEAVGCRDTQLAETILSQIWEDKIEAFHLLHQNTPYIQFGFMSANDAILQASKNKDRLHIIDLGMEHTLQWPSLIEKLASTTNQGVPPKFIRITGILGDHGDMTELESSMETVAAEANALGIELKFHLITGPATPEMLTKDNLQLKEGETLFVNSILHLHTYVKESRGSLKTILQLIKKLGPSLLTVVEQDANHNGPFFLGRFLESLHYYSAIFDSLEACLGRNSMERLKIERNHFAEEIQNIVAYEGPERVERHERADQWRRQLGRAGFQVAIGNKERQMDVMKGLRCGDGYTVGNDQKGYNLLEAVGCRDTQLAETILSQIWYSANPLGDSLQRVSYCFATGLKSRLSLLQTNINANGTIWGGVTLPTDVTREDKIEAFHLLHQNTPYIQFGFMSANDAILQASKNKDRLHIIDLGMEHTLQWPSLIEKLASTTNQGVPPKFIRITGILGDHGDMTELESSMETVAAEANALGIELKFHLITGPATPEMLTKDNLQLKEGETLFVNSILHLHTYVKESRGSLKTILQLIKKLGPSLLTVVEQDANHNGPFFLGRFLESLHYYSAIFDSLEACLGRNSMERLKIERNHFAEEIQNIVAYEGPERVERHERADQWRRQLGRAGFQVAIGNKERQMDVMKGLRCGDGYTVGNDQKGYNLLGWKGRPIMLAAAWQPTSSA